jgi:hypothetical protein
MSELGNLQRKMTRMLGLLFLFADFIGYELTLGEGYDDDNTGHMPGSTHYIKIGQDLNLFSDKVWLDKGPEMEKGFDLLHDFWDLLGGAKRIEGDLNHFSLEYQGRR